MSDTKNKQFHFDLAGVVSLDITGIWPDGDAPENPTVDDVLKVIAQLGGAEKVMEDWGLNFNNVLTVSDGKNAKVAP